MVFRRFNRGQSLRPVNRIKHVIDVQLGGVLAVQNTIIIAESVDNPTTAGIRQVAVGSKINGIYIKLEVNATTSAALSNFYMMVVKNPGNNLVFPNANVIGGNDNKRFVIHQEMVMMQQVTNSNPRTIFSGVVVIPRGYRRMGPDDEIQVMTFSPGVNTNQCLQAHYKEFR